MADPEEIKKKKDGDEDEETVNVPISVLTKIQDQIAGLEKSVEETNAKNAGLEEALGAMTGASTEGEQKLRSKKTYEPKFRLVRVRKFPIAGGDEMGFVVGWTNKGAYQEVDRTGISPVAVDMIDIIFLGHEKTEAGKIKAEKVRLLDLMNKGEQVYCKILEMKKEPRDVPTGEEIMVNTYDPKHGLVPTGETMDGYVTYSDIQCKVQLPDGKGDVWIDAKYLN